jgi:hypothetical protein
MSSAAACATVFFLDIDVISEPTVANAFYPPQARCAASVASTPYPAGTARAVLPFLLLGDVFVKGSDTDESGMPRPGCGRLSEHSKYVRVIYGYLAYPSSIYRFCHRDYVRVCFREFSFRQSPSGYIGAIFSHAPSVLGPHIRTRMVCLGKDETPTWSTSSGGIAGRHTQTRSTAMSPPKTASESIPLDNLGCLPVKFQRINRMTERTP